MFKKNLKSLSLFLILAVLMIGAIGAVSAAGDTFSDVEITDPQYVALNQTSSDGVYAEDAYLQTIVTAEPSQGEGNVPAGTLVDEGNDGIELQDNAVHTLIEDEYEPVEGVTVTGDFSLVDGKLTAETITIDGADQLVHNEEYWLSFLLKYGATAEDDDGDIAILSGTNPSGGVIVWVPFMYSYQYVGVSDIKVNGASNVTVTQSDEDKAESTEKAVEFAIVTDGPSNKSYAGFSVPDGTLVYSITNFPIVFDGKVYTTANDKDSAITDVTVAVNPLFQNKDSLTGTISITGGANLLSNNTVYYAGITVPAQSEAYYTITTGEYAGVGIYSTVGDVEAEESESWTVYYPFTYIAKDSVAVDGNVTVNYGKDNWKMTATVIGAETVKVAVLYGDDDDPVFFDDVTVENGVVTITPDTDDKLAHLDAGVYTFIFMTPSGNSDNATLTVKAINVTVTAKLNETTVSYDDPATLTITLSNIPKEDAVVTVTAINQKTGEQITIDDINLEDTVGTGPMIDNKDNLLPVGTYLVTVEVEAENYNFNTVALNYVVEVAESYIIANPDPLYIPDTEEYAYIDLVFETDNEDEEIVVVEGEVTAVLRDANGNAVKALDFDPDTDKILVYADDVKEGYYVSINYVNAEGNYKPANTNVSVYVRKGSELVLDPEDASYNYGEGDINVTVKITDSTGKVIKVNGSAAIIVEGDLEDTIDIVNGTGKFNLMDLELDAGHYAISVEFVDEDDVYCPAEDIMSVEVYAIHSYVLNVNTTKVVYNLDSDEVIAFNVTYASNTSIIAPYTGDLTYSFGELDDEDELVYYTIPVVDGVATIPVSELEGLEYDPENNPIIYTFLIDGNEVSNTVVVPVTIELLDAEIFTANVTAYEGTGFIIDGFVSNVSGGKVQVTLIEDLEDPTSIIAMVFADVDEIGYFAASFGGLPEGNYTALIVYESAGAIIPPANDEEIGAVINVTVAGEAPEPPVPVNVTYDTVLTIDPFIEVEGAGESLVGRLTLEDGTPVIGMHIQLTLTRVSSGASKTYTTTTDYNGEFQFPINLAAGEYTAQATFDGVTIPSTNVTYEASESEVTPFTVLPANGTVNETTVVIIPVDYLGTYGTPGNFTVMFLVNDTPIVGIPGIEITLTRVSSGASKTYSWFVTDFNGEINMPIELAPGDYTAHIKFNSRTEPYVIDGAEADATITVLAA